MGVPDKGIGNTIVAQEIAWLDNLRAKLDPHVGPAIDTLVTLAKTSPRDMVRLQAASKILGTYAMCVTDAAALKTKGAAAEAVDDADKFRVVVVDRADLQQSSQSLSARYQGKLAAVKDAG